jgi:hypothetical protein
VTKTVFGWSDGGSACEYYRLRVPLDYLQDQGRIHRQIGGHLMTRPHPLTPRLPSQFPDVVIGQRVNRPEPAEMWRMLSTGELGKRPRLVYEVDDDLFNVSSRNPAHHHFNQPVIQDTIKTAMVRADVITVSTDALAEEVRRQLWSFDATVKRIEVIRNALPDVAYSHPDSRIRGWDTAPRAVIGWAGSATHEEDFDEVAGWLGRYISRTGAAEYYAIGHMFSSVQRAVPESLRRHTPWIKDMASYYRALNSFDVGIIPLRPSVFNRSKSDIKFLEYAARGIPAVVSNFGPYAEHVDGWRAWAAEGHHWGEQISAALDGGRYVAEQAYEYARSRHVSSVADQWMEVIGGD